MTRLDAWDLYFAGICSMRFHPRNDGDRNHNIEEIARAAAVADAMLVQRDKRSAKEEFRG